MRATELPTEGVPLERFKNAIRNYKMTLAETAQAVKEETELLGRLQHSIRTGKHTQETREEYNRLLESRKSEFPLVAYDDLQSSLDRDILSADSLESLALLND